jgi:conjugative transfer signal peptidase TraF
MRRPVCRTQKAAVLLLVLWAIIAALFCSERLILNTTGSVPRGIWWVSGGQLQRGDIVTVPTSAFRSTTWVPEVYWRKNAWGKPKAFLKRVAGLPGDTVEAGKNGLIRIAGEVVPNSAPLSADRAGRPLRDFQLPITLASDEIWLLSDSPRGFDSRYLGPAWIEECHKAISLVVF